MILSPKLEWPTQGTKKNTQNVANSRDWIPERIEGISWMFLAGSCTKGLACPYAHNENYLQVGPFWELALKRWICFLQTKMFGCYEWLYIGGIPPALTVK